VLLRSFALVCLRIGVRKALQLTRGIVVGYDSARMTFHFTMMTSGARAITCEISSAAMDAIAGVRGTPPSGRRLQFEALRAEIERIASDVFESSNLVPVRVFAKHIRATKRSE
jgi:hypothetical protein